MFQVPRKKHICTILLEHRLQWFCASKPDCLSPSGLILTLRDLVNDRIVHILHRLGDPQVSIYDVEAAGTFTCRGMSRSLFVMWCVFFHFLLTMHLVPVVRKKMVLLQFASHSVLVGWRSWLTDQVSTAVMPCLSSSVPVQELSFEAWKK